MGIQTLLSFLKVITKDSNLANFNSLVTAVDASCWIHKAISLSYYRLGDNRRWKFFMFILITILVLCAVTSAYRAFLRFLPILVFPVHLRVKEIQISFLDLLERNSIRPFLTSSTTTKFSTGYYFSRRRVRGRENYWSNNAFWLVEFLDAHRLCKAFVFLIKFYCLVTSSSHLLKLPRNKWTLLPLL